MALELVGGHVPGVGQLGEQRRPQLAKFVGAGEAAVTADDDEPVDVVLEQMARRPAQPVALPEGR